MQVLKYLKGTREFGITYSGLGTRPKLEGYINSDYASNHTDQKLTYGFVFMLYGGPIAWILKKQRSVFTFITKAKYVALY
jgi:hypothetical protein